MQVPLSSVQSRNSGSFNPSEGALQLGYREIHGLLPSSNEDITVQAWAIVFVLDAQARDRYSRLVQLLGEVGGDALIRRPIIGFTGNQFVNMSERPNLLGELATLWVTSDSRSANDRGGVLVAFNGPLIQILATNLYIADGNDRPTYLLERIARQMANREINLKLSPQADTMARLPRLHDVEESLKDTFVGINRYTSPLIN